MKDQPKTWHYGLVAEMWANSNRETPELPFLKETIATYGQPVLDLACGAGRLLVPLLESGFEVDGCDISPDMLAGCQARLAAFGLNTNLFRGAMHDFDPPRRYCTVYICNSFGLSGSRTLDELAFERIFNCLEPGGVLLFNEEAPYSLDDWEYWPKESQDKLPESWPEEGKSRIADDGSEYIIRIRQIALNPLEQTFELQIRVEKYKHGEMLAEEERTLRGVVYFKNELVAMLKNAGFDQVSVYGGYNLLPATRDDDVLVYLAVKPI